MTCSVHQQKQAQGMCVHCGKLFCSDCLVEVSGKMYCKEHINYAFNETKEQPAQQGFSTPPNIVINNTGFTGYAPPPYQHKNQIVALLLSIFVGYLGIHRFYVGKVGTGLIWMFTCGLFGIGVLVDIITIAIGTFKDKDGHPLK